MRRRIALDGLLALRFCGEKHPARITLNHFARAERWMVKTGRLREVPPVESLAREAVERTTAAWLSVRDSTSMGYREAVEQYSSTLSLCHRG